MMAHPHMFVHAAWYSSRADEGYREGLFGPRLGTRVERLGTPFSLGARKRGVNQRIVKL